MKRKFVKAKFRFIFAVLLIYLFTVRSGIIIFGSINNVRCKVFRSIHIATEVIQRMKIRHNYTHTLIACYIGFVTQAVIVNFAPLLFLTFHNAFGISLDKIALLITVNFVIQLLVDIMAAKYADKAGYRVCIVTAHVLCAAGLAGLGIFPDLLGDPYIGLLSAVALYAVGGGLIEVLISPTVEACPTDKKSAAMSLLHSFYCWGVVFVVICSTIYFFAFGIERWKVLALLWAAVPFLNAAYFAVVPVPKPHKDEEGFSFKRLLSFRLFRVFILLMVCAGASEQAISQWASAFAEKGLRVSKSTGDLYGPCLFAALMGISRVFYAKFSEKIDLGLFMLFSGITCVAGYLLAALSPYPFLALIGCSITGLSVGVLWPGTYSLSAGKFPWGGTPMFGLLALAGDLGCSAGPAIVGVTATASEDNLKLGILAAVIFPVLLVIGLVTYRRLSVSVK